MATKEYKNNSNPIDEELIDSLGALYLATFDSVLKTTSRTVDNMIKMTSLMSQHIVISDTQALDNKGLRNLILKRKKVVDFLQIPAAENKLPLLISMRPGCNNFEDVLKNMLFRKRPMLFSSLPLKKRKKIEKVYRKGKEKSLGSFYDIAGDDFCQYINLLCEIYGKNNKSIVHWKPLAHNYPVEITKALKHRLTFFQFLKEGGHYTGSDEAARECCEKMNHFINDTEGKIIDGEKVQIDRSILYDFIDQFPHPNNWDWKGILKHTVLDKPYHGNFAFSNRFDRVLDREMWGIGFNDYSIHLSKQAQEAVPLDELKIKKLPLNFDEVSYEQIAELRGGGEISKLLANMKNSKDETEYVESINLLLDYLTQEFEKHQKTATEKAWRIVRSFRAPLSWRHQLAEEDVSRFDAISYVSRALSLLFGVGIGTLEGHPKEGYEMGSSLGDFIDMYIRNIHEARNREDELNRIIFLIHTHRK